MKQRSAILVERWFRSCAVAWLLLVPPRGVEPTPPLDEWTEAGCFESAEKCDAHLESRLEGGDVRFVGAACARSDDSRLGSAPKPHR